MSKTGYSPDEAKVMRFMYDHGGITRRDASSKLNIEHLGARIFDLRHFKGIPIENIPIPPLTKGGKRHSVYCLDPKWAAANERP